MQNCSFLQVIITLFPLQYLSGDNKVERIKLNAYMPTETAYGFPNQELLMQKCVLVYNTKQCSLSHAALFIDLSEAFDTVGHNLLKTFY